ncbi:MAG: hypothetical protein OHK93_004399 [Ramalina farinacea]|uniref:Biogenesis of lysosome-related organelles complex 1 subunit CNL1 n=1 Tax=Ramalina farinacea TaxID=258253 RepID=A0AA43U1L5_9LECA|nr:hypothetical protein [Ramalina farinacea]
MPSLPTTIADTQLGLTQAELHILRQHQQVALSAQPTPSHSHNPSLASTRGRGTARVSNSSSRAASNASSHAGGAGRLLLDASSLAALSTHFANLMGAIERKLDQFNAQSAASISAQQARASKSIAHADVELARVRQVLQTIDDLENEYDKIRNIRNIVKSFRGRVESLERRVDSKTSSKGRGGGSLSAGYASSRR